MVFGWKDSGFVELLERQVVENLLQISLLLLILQFRLIEKVGLVFLNVCFIMVELVSEFSVVLQVLLLVKVFFLLFFVRCVLVEILSCGVMWIFICVYLVQEVVFWMVFWMLLFSGSMVGIGENSRFVGMFGIFEDNLCEWKQMLLIVSVISLDLQLVWSLLLNCQYLLQDWFL